MGCGLRTAYKIWTRYKTRTGEHGSNSYAFLDPSLNLVAFLLNYFTCFPIHDMIVLTGSWEPGPESRKAYVLDRTLLPLTGTKEPISFLPYGHK